MLLLNKRLFILICKLSQIVSCHHSITQTLYLRSMGNQKQANPIFHLLSILKLLFLLRMVIYLFIDHLI